MKKSVLKNGVQIGTLAVLCSLGVATVDAAPDAEPLFAKARKAASAAKSLTGNLRVTITQGKESGKMWGAIRLMRPNYGSIALRGSGPFAKGGIQQFLSTGKQVFVVSTEEKKFLKVAAEPKGQNLFLVLGRILTPVVGFTDPGMIRREGIVRSISAVQVNGKPYQKVAIAAMESPNDRNLFFGKSGLLEGMEYVQKGESGNVMFKVWLEDIKLNPPLTAAQFAYTPPAGYSLRDTSNEAKLLAMGSKAPDFKLPGAFGGSYSLKELSKGKKATLISFWFQNCGPCRMELPHLAEQYPTLKKRGLVILAINTDDSAKDVQKVIFDDKLNFPVAVAMDTRDKIINAYKIEAFPTAYLLNSDGKIVWRRVGYDPAGLDAALEKVLKK
jgi:peroxiredoxin/outer membrane lipoprotein-sorting protein